MAYLSDNNPNTSFGLLPGDAVPIRLNYISLETTEGFSQTTLIQGSLTDTPYSLNPNYYSFAGNNGIGTGWGGVQDYPIINLQPPATTFNFDIPGGDGTANTQFANVLAGTSPNSFLTVTPNPSGANSTTRGTYTVAVDSAAFTTAVQAAENNPTATSINQVTGQTGSFTSSGSDRVVDFLGDYTSGDPQGTGSYIKTAVSGNNVDITFERNLYESFAADGTTLTADAQAKTLTFEPETDSNVEITTGTDKIIVGEVVPPLSHSTLQTDDGSVTATQLNDSAKFTNTSTSDAVKAVLGITAAGDEIRFTMTPNARVGFGTHLCIIGNQEPSNGQRLFAYEGTSQFVRFRVYECYVITWDPDSPYDDSTTSGQLWDFSLNSFSSNAAVGRTDPACGTDAQGTSPLVGDLIDPSSAVTKFTYADFKCGEVVLAQNIRPGVWAMGMTSNMKAFCQ